MSSSTVGSRHQARWPGLVGKCFYPLNHLTSTLVTEPGFEEGLALLSFIFIAEILHFWKEVPRVVTGKMNIDGPCCPLSRAWMIVLDPEYQSVSHLPSPTVRDLPNLDTCEDEVGSQSAVGGQGATRCQSLLNNGKAYGLRPSSVPQNNSSSICFDCQHNMI